MTPVFAHNWARRSLIATGMHRADPSAQAPYLEKLRRAAREKRQVDMLYQSTRKAEATQRQIDPYALVHRTGWWYLVGYCHLRDAPRTFRVDRIQTLELLSQTFQMPDDFDIHAYLESEFADQPVVHAKLRFTARRRAHRQKQHLGLGIARTKTQTAVWMWFCSAPDLPWLASMALSFASLVTVLEPPELRDMVRDWARSVVEQYL